MAARPLDFRCLTLTGAFETDKLAPECFAAVAGDFDGQGLSFGALQWNLGQGSLQPLLREMLASYPETMTAIFGASCDVIRQMLRGRPEEQLDWARSIQAADCALAEPWRSYFEALGHRDEFQFIQVKQAGELFESAVALCREFSLVSERGVALAFDIRVQNGHIPARARGTIAADLAAMTAGDALLNEVQRLRIVANRLADASDPRWQEEVRARKLAIANGEGIVHARRYQLAEQFGIGLRVFAGGEPA